MNILMLSGTYPPDKCGVGDYTSKVYNALLEANVKDDIYLLSSKELLKNGERLPLKPLHWNLFGITRIIDIIKRINPDIINFQFPTTPYRMSISVLFLVVRLKQIGFYIVTTLHEYSYSPKLAQFRTRFIIKSSHQLIVVDEQYKNDIADRKLMAREDILFIPIGSNIERSKLSVEDIKLLRNQYLVGPGILIGYFGFIFPSKGIESLVRLGHELKRQGRIFKIIIAADLSRADKYHQKIERLIKTSGLDNEIIVMGYLSSIKVADLLKSMDVVVFPFTKGISTKNGSVLAALNQGVNVISTKSNHVQDSPYELLHLIDHHTNIKQVINIIDNQLIYNVNQEIITWEEIGNRTMNFLISNTKSKDL